MPRDSLKLVAGIAKTQQSRRCVLSTRGCTCLSVALSLSNSFSAKLLKKQRGRRVMSIRQLLTSSQPTCLCTVGPSAQYCRDGQTFCAFSGTLPRWSPKTGGHHCDSSAARSLWGVCQNRGTPEWWLPLKPRSTGVLSAELLWSLHIDSPRGPSTYGTKHPRPQVPGVHGGSDAALQKQADWNQRGPPSPQTAFEVDSTLTALLTMKAKATRRSSSTRS